MSLRADVLHALSIDLPLSKAQIVEETGHEAPQVGNVLNRLQAAGKCRRTADGWLRINGTQPSATRRRDIAEPKPEPPPKRKYTRKAKPNGNGANGVAIPVPAVRGKRAGSVDFTYFGEFVVLRRTDIAELLALMERWRAVASG